jgi:hypothetical protein
MPELILSFVVVASIATLVLLLRSARRSGEGFILCRPDSRRCPQLRELRDVEDSIEEHVDRLRMEYLRREMAQKYPGRSYSFQLAELYRQRGALVASRRGGDPDRTDWIRDRILLARERALLSQSHAEVTSSFSRVEPQRA